MEVMKTALLAGGYFATIAKQSHFAATVSHFLNKSCIAECMNCGLAIQKYTVSEIKRFFTIGRLMESMFHITLISCLTVNVTPVGVQMETH